MVSDSPFYRFRLDILPESSGEYVECDAALLVPTIPIKTGLLSSSAPDPFSEEADRYWAGADLPGDDVSGKTEPDQPSIAWPVSREEEEYWDFTSTVKNQGENPPHPIPVFQRTNAGKIRPSFVLVGASYTPKKDGDLSETCGIRPALRSHQFRP